MQQHSEKNPTEENMSHILRPVKLCLISLNDGQWLM